MQALRELKDVILNIPIFTAADISSGARMMPGVTTTDSSAKDLGTAILSDATGVDVIGYMDGLYDYSEVGSSAPYTGATWVFHSIKPCFNGVVCRAEIDLSDTMAVAGYSAGTVTVTSLEDNIDSSWLYGVAGTGLGQVGFVNTSASGSCTLMSALTTAWDTDTTLVKIPRIFHGLQKPNTAMTKFGTDAAAGTMRIKVLNTWISRNGMMELLDPTKHHGISGLNGTTANTKFFVDYLEIDTLGTPID